MSHSIHLFKLLLDADTEIKILIPKTIIKGYGFEKLTYITNEDKILRYAEIEFSQIYELIELWKFEKGEGAIIKQNKKIEKFTKNTKFFEEFVIQEHINGAEEVFFNWNEENGFKVSRAIPENSELSMKNDLTIIKSLINLKIKPQNLKVESITLSYLLKNISFFFLGLEFYSFSRISHQLLTPRSFPLLPNLPKHVKIPLKSKIFSQKNIKIKQKIDSAISDITKNDESIKNITYESWINKVNHGEKLFPNEDLFAKKIGKKKPKKISVVKCGKELRIMSMKMRISLAEKKNNATLNEGLRKNIEEQISLKRASFMILNPGNVHKTKIDLSEISERSARNLLEKSVSQLNALEKRFKKFREK